MKMYGYFRQSNEEGHKKDLSIPRQRDHFHRDAERRREAGEDIEVIEAPADEGVSGGDWPRPGLEWIRERLVPRDEVWVYDEDRLVRHAVQAPALMTEWAMLEVKVWSSGNRLIPYSTAIERLLTDMRMRYGAFFKEKVGEDIKATRDKRMSGGYWTGRPPWGYAYADESGRGSRRVLVPGEDADSVREMFRRLARGDAAQQVAAWLGVARSVVYHHRSNPAYIGLVYKDRREVMALTERSHKALWRLSQDEGVPFLAAGRHEPLIDPETWDRVQRRYLPTAQRIDAAAKYRYGLSGVLHCADCGSLLTHNQTASRNVPAMRCQNCGYQRAYHFFEAAVVQGIAATAARPQYQERVEQAYAVLVGEPGAEANPVLHRLRSERQDAERQVGNAVRAALDAPALAKHLAAEVTRLEKRQRELDREITAQVAQVASTQPARDEDWQQLSQELRALAEVEEADRFWRSLDAPNQRALLLAAYDRIETDGLTLVLRRENWPADLRLPVGRRTNTGRGRLMSVGVGGSSGCRVATYSDWYLARVGDRLEMAPPLAGIMQQAFVNPP